MTRLGLLATALFIGSVGITGSVKAQGVFPTRNQDNSLGSVRGVVTMCQGSDGYYTPCAAGSGSGGTSASNISEFGGTTVNLGRQTMAASIPVAIASDQVWGLPTGAATATLQSINKGVIGAAVAPAQMALIGCVFNTTAPTLASGQSAACQMTAGGQIRTQDSTIAAGVTNIVSGAAGSIAFQMAGVFNSTPITTVTGHGSALQIDAQGDLRSVGGIGVPLPCTSTSTSATINTATTLLNANLATRHLKIQNNGTAAVLYSFTTTLTLTPANSFSLAAGAVYEANAEFTPTSALTVQSATASQPVMCEYN